MTHLALYLAALACAVRGLRRRSVAALAWAGGLSGLAFLCRPEGAEVALGTFVVALTAAGWSWRDRLRCAAAVCMAALLVASPYMLVTGSLVRKKPVSEFVPVAGARSPGLQVRLKPAEGTRDARVPPAEAGGKSGSAEADLADSAAQRALATVWEYEDRTDGASSRPSKLTAEREGIQLATVWEYEDRTGEPLACAWGSILAKTADLPRVLRAALMIGEKYARTLRVTLLLPAIAYLALRRKEQREGAVPPADPAVRLLLVISVLHLAIVARLLFAFDYWEMLSIRHVLVLGAITVPFAAAGVVMILRYVASERRRLVAAAIAAGLIAPTLPWMLAPRNDQDVYLRRAGEWIRSQEPSGARVLTTRNMAAFYANGVHVWSPVEPDVGRILAEARAGRPGWMVFDEQRITRTAPAFFSELRDAARPGEVIELVHKEMQRNRDKLDTARVYRYQAAGN
jgi:hypothetical protein